MTEARDAVLEMNDVRRDFGSTVALKRADVLFVSGESVAIVGPSGSGKSTLLSLLGLLDTPTSGKYVVGGQEVSSLSEGARAGLRASTFGFVFQAFHLVQHLTCMENVELSLELAGIERGLRRNLASEALANVGLSNHASDLPYVMSGGEQQRLAIARATARRPLVLLCDEPTGNLDSANASVALDLILTPHRPDQVTVIVTHDLTVANKCTRIVSVRDGIATDEVVAGT